MKDPGLKNELDHLLEEDHSSPVGWIVKGIPKLSFTPYDLSPHENISCCSDIDIIQAVAIAAAAVVGIFVLSLSSFQLISDGNSLWSPLVDLYSHVS